jgi:protein-S-isoprenylcysteine O-methyltransferase Ste14
MMVALGNFLFHFRNALFPLAYLLLFCPSPRLLKDDYLALGIGILIALLGQVLRVITIGLVYIRRGGKNRHVYADTLVTDGMFRHCRNPLYVGNFLILLGLAFIANSAVFLSIGIPFFFFVYWAIISAEENFLSNKFGADFKEYVSRVNRVIPNFSGFGQTWAGHSFKWRRVIVKEYGTAFIWMAGAILLIERNRLLNHAYGDSAVFHTLMISLALALILLFAVARYLKKKEILMGD